MAQHTPAAMLTALQQERQRRSAERSLYDFVRHAWDVVEPGIEFVPSWHIEVICKHLEAVTYGQVRRLLINIPPRHSKSTIVSVMWPMWEWIHSPREKFLCASYSSTLSIRDNLKCRRLLQSPWFQRHWSDKFLLTGDQNQKQRFENSHTGYRIATSVGGTATGEGGSRLILDDPHGAQDAQSDAMRESAIEWFDVVWSTRLNDPKRDAMVTIMQRLHESDVSGHILQGGGWEHLCIPAEWDGKRRKTSLGPYDPRTERGELICPARFGPKEVETLKRSLGAYGASGQLQQDPVPTGGGILKTDHLQMWPAAARRPPLEFVLQSYDCAFTEKTTGDPSACTVWGVFTHMGKHNVILLDAWDEHLSYPDLRQRAVEDYSAEYGADNNTGDGTPVKGRRPDRVLIEEKASGQSLIQDLRIARVPVIPYNPGRADKVSRAHQAAPILEQDCIWIPESTKTQGQMISWARSLITQLTKFPVAEHDDLVDTFTQAMIWLRDAGFFELPQAAEFEDPDEWRNRDNHNPYAV